MKPDLLAQLADLANGDQWRIADLLVEEFPPEEFGDLGTGVNTGLHSELEDYEHELLLQYGITLKATTMRRMRATAIGWPSGDRVATLPFDVCSRLRGPNRFAEADRYLKRNKGRALNRRIVARFRAEDKPGKEPPPWEETARRRIESTVKNVLLENIIVKREEWWESASIDLTHRKAVIAILGDLMDRLHP